MASLSVALVGERVSSEVVILAQELPPYFLARGCD